MKVLLVDDHVLFAQAVQVALDAEGIGTVTIVTRPDDVLAVVRDRTTRPDVILMDTGLPGERGLTLGARLLQEDPEARILALTADSDPEVLRETVRTGFRGCVSKDTPISELVEAIRAVAEGATVAPPTLITQVPTAVLPRTDDQPADAYADLLASQLTPREREILQLIAEGWSSNEIAQRANISRNTVRSHVQSILGKLGVHSRLEAAALAMRHGWISTKTQRSA